MPTTTKQYKFPQSMIDELGAPKTVSLAVLDVAGEIMAFNRSNTDSRAKYELVKQALVEWDGQPVSIGDGSADRAFDHCHPQVRGCLVVAYAKMSSVKEDDLKYFLDSEVTKVG